MDDNQLGFKAAPDAASAHAGAGIEAARGRARHRSSELFGPRVRSDNSAKPFQLFRILKR